MNSSQTSSQSFRKCKNLSVNFVQALGKLPHESAAQYEELSRAIFREYYPHIQHDYDQIMPAIEGQEFLGHSIPGGAQALITDKMLKNAIDRHINQVVYHPDYHETVEGDHDLAALFIEQDTEENTAILSQVNDFLENFRTRVSPKIRQEREQGLRQEL